MSSIVIKKFGNPRHRQRMAMFDFDWTLVKPKSGKTFPAKGDITDWMWLRPEVPSIVKSFYEKGFAIVVFTNQSKRWKEQLIESVLQALGVPCTVAIAFDKMDYKPNRTMFDSFIRDRKFDQKKSFFVGDALGRAADFADSDKKFAETIGVRVMAPEEVFPFAEREAVEVKPVKRGQEVVIMVGYPGSGKSTFARSTFGSFENYEIVDGDVVKTQSKMLLVGKHIIEAGNSVVFDATNPSKERRASFITLAQQYNLPVRCIHVQTSFEEAVARNNARWEANHDNANDNDRKKVPMIAYYVYRKNFEEPSSNEGCVVVRV